MWRNINELQFFKWQKANSIVLELKKKINKKIIGQENKNELDRTEFILKAFENIWRPCLNFVKTLLKFFRKSEERRLVCQSFKTACSSFSVWICTLSLLPLLLFLCVFFFMAALLKPWVQVYLPSQIMPRLFEWTKRPQTSPYEMWSVCWLCDKLGQDYTLYKHPPPTKMH